MNRITLVAGLQAGDEGKGSIVDALVRKAGASLVVRYNGGPQAAHHVVTDDGREHCFSQWGAGTLAGAQTYLSRHVVVEPRAMVREAVHLDDLGVDKPWRLLSADPDCLVVTPWHKALNQMRELARGGDRHGSCGRGVGEVMAAWQAGEPCIRLRDLAGENEEEGSAAIFAVIDCIRAWAQETDLFALPEETRLAIANVSDGMTRTSIAEWWDDARDAIAALELSPFPPDADVVVFEGAQGVLLDEWHGFHPHTTWSTCTFANARGLLKEWGVTGEVQRLGVLRAFQTRHGAGPFPTEVFNASANPADWDTVMRLSNGDHNGPNAWQQRLRVGHLDAVLARYAIDVCGVDGLALTCLDRVGPFAQVASAYDTRGIDQGLADESFVHGGSVTATSIRLGTTGLLARQERLGQALRQVVPVYEPLCKMEPVRTVEVLLDTPVVCVSRGPRASAKEWR